MVRVQLFWMTDEGWAAERSIFLDAEEGTTCRLVFRIPPGPACHALRFDPGEGPGALVIRSVTVIQTGEKRKVVWSGTTAAELRRLEPGGDAVIDPASDPFKVVSVGADPRLYLNAVGAPAGIGLEVEIVATYITAPGDQIEALRSAVIRLQSAATAAAESAGAIAGLKGELDRLRLKDEILQTTVAREKEVYSASLAEIRDLSTGQWRAVAERLDRSRDELAHLRAEVGKIDVRHTRHQETLEALARDFATGMETLKTDGERTRQEGAERQKLETEQRRVLAVLAATRASLEAAEKQLMLNREYLTGHAATIDGLEQALIRRDAELGESRQEQRSLALNVQHIQDQLGRLAQELAAAREQSAVLHALQEKMTREKDILIATLEAERQTRQRQEDSFIWRVTTPLRRFSSWFLRLLN